MEPGKISRPSDEEVTQRLREAARRRRPSSLAALLLVLSVFLGPLAVFVWWTWPEPEPPRLAIIVEDQLARPKEEVPLHVFLQPIEAVDGKPRLGGLAVAVEERHVLMDRELEKVSAASKTDGSATVAWQCPEKTATLGLIARYAGSRKRRGAEDRARLFIRPAGTPLLLVDIADALSPAAPAAWEKNILDIPPRPDAGKALQAAAKRGYQVLYLALAAESPLVYRKYRGWVLNQEAGASPFPAGPVLGKPAYSLSAGGAREAVLRNLKSRFDGPLTALVGDGQTSAVCRALGVRTLLLGNDEAPKEVIRLPDFGKLADRLSDK